MALNFSCGHLACRLEADTLYDSIHPFLAGVTCDHCHVAPHQQHSFFGWVECAESLARNVMIGLARADTDLILALIALYHATPASTSHHTHWRSRTQTRELHQVPVSPCELCAAHTSCMLGPWPLSASDQVQV